MPRPPQPTSSAASRSTVTAVALVMLLGISAVAVPGVVGVGATLLGGPAREAAAISDRLAESTDATWVEAEVEHLPRDDRVNVDLALPSQADADTITATMLAVEQELADHSRGVVIGRATLTMTDGDAHSREGADRITVEGSGDEDRSRHELLVRTLIELRRATDERVQVIDSSESPLRVDLGPRAGESGAPSDSTATALGVIESVARRSPDTVFQLRRYAEVETTLVGTGTRLAMLPAIWSDLPEALGPSGQFRADIELDATEEAVSVSMDLRPTDRDAPTGSLAASMERAAQQIHQRLDTAGLPYRLTVGVPYRDITDYVAQRTP